ncbi:MAG: CgeB family protein [Chloroflexota bacterium]
MKIAFFGSSLVSAYWNGAATYYRGIIRALHGLGHCVTFYEPDAYERQAHRDMADPDWARVVVYQPGPEGSPSDETWRAIDEARAADLVIKASGVGIHDSFLEAALLDLRRSDRVVAFWDVDAPATLDRLAGDAGDPFHALVPRYDLILTYGGGDPVTAAYETRGARLCVPIYNGLDPDTHFPAPPDPRFEADLAFLGNRLPDREARVEDFFLGAACASPDRRFLLAGNGWADKLMPDQVRYLGHLSTVDHNAFNSTPLAVLNIARESMARYGFSPATRVFEAAGAGACLITDLWEGLDLFLEPGREILTARDGAEVATHLHTLTPKRATEIGLAARRRVLASHTYAHRAARLAAVLGV